MASIDALRAAALISLSVLASSGCTSMASRTSPLPTEGPTVIEVYESAVDRIRTGERASPPKAPASAAGSAGAQRSGAARQVADVADTGAASVPAAYAATAVEPMQQRFARLPNPDLVMYVFPHMARGRYPVPGYLTVFPMYETIEYAMPGEVPSRPVQTQLVRQASQSAGATLPASGTAPVASRVAATVNR